ncbi:hypothetical protein LCGC14_0507700 [marine sediment metagenome]|uniref:Uncharacterized protein n=1 Tax=marine sediment metagenome TaxID=412755 RepID=A0A0F9UNU6_9ZZZZ|nr:hypothetical protein [Methylophaga sp.]HEC59299.1 hypothetical protein [Methylophaga sp.]
MKKLTTLLKILSIVSVMGFAVSACDNNDGPAEKAGESIDNATTDMGNAVEDACEKAKEGVNAQDTDC